MKITKKAITVMIAASIATTAFPVAAMANNNLSNTLTSAANIAALQTATTLTMAPESNVQTATSAPPMQADIYQESMFITQPNGDGTGVVITGFKTDGKNFTSDVVIPRTIERETVLVPKNTNSDYHISMINAR